MVIELKLCLNCLKSGHDSSNCRSRRCKICEGVHNTLLHQDSPQPDSSNPKHDSISPNTSTNFGCHSNSNLNAILSTALININNSNGSFVTIRVLLDSGSQPNFLTDSVCQFLGLNRIKTSLPISGINGSSTKASFKAIANISSRISDFKSSAEFLIVPQITGNIPSSNINCNSWDFPNVNLADPTWNISAKVDGLLGVQLFWQLLGDNKVHIPNAPAILQDTRLGWIVCSAEKDYLEEVSHCYSTTLSELDDHLQAFWRLEDTSGNHLSTGEDLACEVHFAKTVRRDPDGRYIVQIPLRKNPSELGSSRDKALIRFYNLESKLRKPPLVYQQYKDFMNEYERLGHMMETEDNEQPEYFIPHHAVYKASSSTTKLRVVFDASTKTDSGLSLNDISMVGPFIQDSLFDILLRFRSYNYVMMADIEKMYRQTKVHIPHCNLQKILWRNNPTEDVKAYKLMTITYGTASAPYLATRTLHQLFLDEGSNFSHAMKVERDFYVDDLMTGCNTIADGLTIQRDVINLLKQGKFPLRKLCANNSALIKDIPVEEREDLRLLCFDGYISSTVKALGLTFDIEHDQFIFHINISDDTAITKRGVLSEISKIFDPLGVIGPVILTAKIFMQKLWREGLGWDEPLPNPLRESWINYKTSLSSLEQIRIDRQATVSPSRALIELHAFSDASEMAYGTCVYIRSIDPNSGSVLGVNLLCSKSRLAPLKTTSLPRLELCGGLLMTQLCDTISKALSIDKNNIYYWTDSTIVLAWLHSPSTHWTTFVANRVAKVQELSDIGRWQHISGVINPADLMSRGLNPKSLATSPLWWHGPSFLTTNTGPTQSFSNSDLYISSDPPERRKNAIVLQAIESPWGILQRYSSINKLIRIISYCRRFITNSRIGRNEAQCRLLGPLNSAELNNSLKIILTLTQQDVFAVEIRDLCKGNPVHRTSKLSNLNPFLGDDGLIRVGGRIENADVSNDQKHPIVLPPVHHITKLIAKERHLTLLHCGPQSLLAAIRLKYWPISGRHLTKSIVQNCITCFRAKPKGITQIMGQLPAARVQKSRPFTHCGIDYACPIYIRLNQTRKSPIVKCYVTLFVCLAVKAIHIEIVEDLSTDSFISTLRRFIARRGKPTCIYSDNSSTFSGAANQIQALQNFLSADAAKNAIISFAESSGIRWTFIPPYSPHMGGLWEANIKQVKYHLRRTMGAHTLTYVNLYTLLVEIEACVNSRPLLPLSNDPSDLNYLSPAHFLIGESFHSLPDPDLQLVHTNRLTQWQLVQQMKQSFWSRWSKWYLSELQKRAKWKTQHENIQGGTLVLIQETRTSPLRWRLGRVMETHKGADNQVRVVTLKPEAGITKRAITRICPLPISDEDSSI